MNIRGFLISIVVVSLFVGVLGLFYANVADEYENATLDSESSDKIAAYNELAAIQEASQELNETLFREDDSTEGTVDLLGKFLGSGFNVLKVAKQSFSAFFRIGTEATENSYLGEATSLFSGALLLVAMIILMFIIISVLVGREI